MVKWVVVKLTDREYQILDNLEDIEGTTAEKLKELFTSYLLQTPRFKVDYHVIKLDETKEHLQQVLELIWNEYQQSPNPLDLWDEDKFDRIKKELIQVNALRPMGGRQFAPTYLFKKPWLSVFNNVNKVFPEHDEFSQAYIATIYMLDYLSKVTFDDELLKDATIILNEFYMYTYAVAKKKAHEFQRSIIKR
jgi:hypothetical protein